MLRDHLASRNLLVFSLYHIADGPTAPDGSLDALNIPEFYGGDEIPRDSAVACYGYRLALGDFPVLAEIAGEFCRWDFTHCDLTFFAQIIHFTEIIRVMGVDRWPL